MSIPTNSLDDLCELIVDCPHSTPEWTKSGVVVIRNSDIKKGRLDLSQPSYTTEEHFAERTRRAIPSFGDLVITREAPMGEIAMIPSELQCCMGQRQVLLRPKSDPKYILYAIQSPYVQRQIRGHDATGSTVSNLCIPDLKELRIPDLPRKSEVADVLGAIDEAISVNDNLASEAEELAMLLYDYWFLQFDFPMTPDHAASINKPDLAGSPYRSAGGRMVYDQKLKREIPDGWCVSTIGETLDTHLGGTPARESEEYWVPGEVHWLSSGEYPDLFVLQSDEKISNLGLRSSAAKVLQPGTVIISIVRHLRASILGIPAATNQSVVGICESESLRNCFIYPYLVREIPRLMRLRTGAQQPHINKGVLDESLVVIPDDTTLAKYTQAASSIYAQIENCNQKKQQLGQFRDWLLPILMNGQATVVKA